MESPVRIYLSAAIVVHLLLLSNSNVQSSALPPPTPPESTTTTLDVRRNTPGYVRVNSTTWIPRRSTSTEEPLINDIGRQENESVQTKDEKLKTRGTVRYSTQKYQPTASIARRRAPSSTNKYELDIVTPTPQKKNITEIIDSMRKYKSTKIPKPATTSTTTAYTDEDESATEYSYTNDDAEHDYDISKFTSSEFHNNDNVYTFPGTSSDDLYSYSAKEKDNKTYKDISRSPFEEQSGEKLKDTYGPKNLSYKQFTRDSYDNFFGDIDLTTPRHDYFDQKFKEVSQSIAHNLERHKAQTTKPENTHRENIHGVDVTKSLNVEEFMNKKPSNNSQLFFHKSKSILVSDNEAEGSSLSDVQGTSIYFETSMLSTETYTITEPDCDNETRTDESRPNTPPDNEVNGPLERTTEPTLSTTETPIITSVGTDYPNRNLRVSPKRIHFFNTPNNKDITKDGTFAQQSDEISSNDLLKPIRRIQFTTPGTSTQTSDELSSNNLQKPIKRLSFTTPGTSTQTSDEISSNDLVKPIRRIQFTTPKSRVTYRISVKRNSSLVNSTRPRYPTTIYAEHFNIKDKQKNVVSDINQTLLTTVSSAIDPVYEEEISGTKKVVHSHTISDNSIPSLRKRGSTKFSGSSTADPPSSEDAVSSYFMAIPTASSSWGALAGMRNPPLLTSPTVNVSASRTNIDENELQRVTEITDTKPSSTSSIPTTSTTISNNINIDMLQKKPGSLDQNWRPLYVSPQENSSPKPQVYVSSESAKIVEIITSRPLESPPTTLKNELKRASNLDPASDSSDASSTTGWIPVNKTDFTNIPPMTTHRLSEKPENMISSTMSSNNIKLPSIPTLASNATTQHVEEDVTTHSAHITHEGSSETIMASSSLPSVKEKEISESTTFTYIPISTIATVSDLTTIETEEGTSTESPEIWHPIRPATKNSTVQKFVDNIPVTTYRPFFIGTDVSETTTETQTELQTLSTQENLTTTVIVTKDDVITNEDSKNLTNATDIINETVTDTVQRETTTAESVQFKTPEVKVTTEEITTPKREETTVVIVTETSFSPTEKISEEPINRQSNVTDNKEISGVTQVSEITNVSAVDALTTEVITNVDFAENITTATVLEVTTEDLCEDGETTRTVSKLEDLTSNFADDLTTQSPYNNGTREENSSAAGVAIAVSTIGVIALLLLIGLLLVLRRRRRRGRRCGVYAQRCTPVSLDAYSLDSVSVGRRKANHRLRASKRSYGNPAYDDEVVISHPMQYAALANFALDSESIAAEFSEIPAGSVRADEVPPGCEDKNRYSNVLPLPETRVPLQRIDNDPKSEYINANYVTGPGSIKNYYIACQAPMSNTVADFWRMMWEQNSRVIIMLTEYMENGVEKCYEYLPPSEVTDNKRTFGDFQIILKRREHRDKYAVSTVQLKNMSTKTWREVSHLWYFWPAKGVPEDYESVINFMSEMRSHMKISQNAKEFDEDDTVVVENGSASNLSKLKTDSSPVSGKGVHVYSPQKAEEMMRKANGANGTLGRMKAAAELEGVRPCVVMCASGAGRTGALLALDVCARALEGAGAVDVPRTVRTLRTARPHALQNKHQYIFLYKVLSEYGNKLTGGGVDSI